MSGFILGNPLPLKAQHKLNREVTLQRAEAHSQGFRNDSTISITTQLLKELKAHGQFDTPFGIRVQLINAMALERDEQNEQAMQNLLRVRQQSNGKNLSEIHARVCLTMALLYEKAGLRESSREQLALAKADIDHNRLSQVYPYFAIRMASWERLYGSRQNALFLARQALTTAGRHQLILEQAISHMLLNMLLPRSSSFTTERLQHCQAAVRLYRQLGDYTGCSSMLLATSQIYAQRRAFQRALAYSDPALAASGKAYRFGHQHGLNAAFTYQLRGSIYQLMGRADSALANMQRGYELELAASERDVAGKIVEIEARYQRHYKKQQLEEQRLALRLKENQLSFSVSIVCLVLILLIVLYKGYQNLQRDKHILVEKNTLIQQQASQLRTLDTAKSRFFANVSHELRTPLTLLIGPVGALLRENHLTNQQATLLQIVYRSSKQLEQLVTDILDLGKMELGKMDLITKPTQLVPFFQSHLAQFESLATDRHLHYRFDVDIADTTEVELDQLKYRQLLSNLLTNAFKFTQPGGSVTVTAGLTASELWLRVADTGPGIHPDDLPYLFDRYFQTTRPNRPAEGGTGIGLALCQEYVRLMGGTIDVESTLNSGSAFRVLVPVVVRSVSASSPAERNSVIVPEPTITDLLLPVCDLRVNLPVDAPVTDRPTILVVEDNPDLQTYLRLLLSARYRVETADNGQSALARLGAVDEPTISLVLSDLMMPAMDGHQLLEQLKSADLTRHLPVVILTARADVQDKLRALRIGVDDYLLKPFDAEELLTRIDNLLANQASRLQATVTQQRPDPAHPVLSEADQQWLETFEQYIQQNLSDATLTIPEIAHHFAMSESTLLRQLKRLAGLSPLQYVQAIRLEEARRLLESRANYSVAHVAVKVGYTDARSFGRSYRARFGKRPTDLSVS